ncbi:hypothetical protein COCMIDRAFT_36275 [Bipolaris oryzae ATCC 44560]|uniref:Uncharacterized protein n=1 Tax=Bipolaris oryzae ATCC 44560 TaxID=930090 RepID=W6Z7T9_COCMI|nr:uncharacterized protein COCMIDRAFT_36275 [Bipolaris oryzae ATCC 44560]EUC46075.1 hypothetical protein COCMIDRAFT_36275 [Bipolaris oryzae ATCC 44560]
MLECWHQGGNRLPNPPPVVAVAQPRWQTGVAATPTSGNRQLNDSDLGTVKQQYPLISLGILILECGTVSKTGQLSSATASSMEKKQGEQETVIESQYQPFDLP